MRTGDMTVGSVRRAISGFALPIFLSQLFQQLYNAADSLIVGNLLGKQALAAVSSTSALLNLMTSLMFGVAVGAGVVISNRFGAGDDEGVSDAIHTTVAFGIAAGVLLTVLGVALSPILLRWMGTAEDVMEGSLAYFRNYFTGSLAVMLYNVFTGIMNALGDSRRPLHYLIFSSMLNVALDVLFIAGFGFGVGSAATATVISQVASTVLCVIHLCRPGTAYRLRLNRIRFHPTLLRDVIRMGLPTGVQNSVISIANVLVQSNINSFGSDAMAACGTYSKLQGFASLPITAFSMALTTFVSQNLGAKKYDRAREGARFGIIACVSIAEIIGLTLVCFAPTFVRAFNADPKVVEIASAQARIEGWFLLMLSFSHAVSGVCRGAGKAAVPMFVMLGVWCALRIAYITVGMSITHDIRILFWAYPLTWTISSVIFLIYLLKSDWVHGFDRKEEATA